MKQYQKNGFTIVELIVAATILIILTAVWFYSYSQNLEDTRDSLRKSDIANLESQLKLYKQKRWAYPIPGDKYEITNQWISVAYQWKMNEKVPLTTATAIPTDPFTKGYYVYSTLLNKQEFEASLSLENAGNPIAVVVWDYKSVSKNVLPTISLAIDSTSAVEIHDWVWWGSTNRLAFIFDQGSYNIPYSFESPFSPVAGGTNFDALINDATIQYWQNSDFRSCDEIYQSGKSISNGLTSEQYQILNSTWALIDTPCDFS